MFDRVSFKKEARSKLRCKWGPAAAVSLIFILITACIAKQPFTALLITGILASAMSHYFLEFKNSPEGKCPSFDVFISGFENWFHGFIAFLWKSLWIILWSLLFIIPGIVKIFAYSQVFFLITEYPELSPKKALRISIAMTNGHKSELFFLYMSFLGWFLLSIPTCGILLVWVIPYFKLSTANAYEFLKNAALYNGSITQQDLSSTTTSGDIQ